MKIIFHGKFAEDYGKEHEINANSIGEGIAALTRQLKFHRPEPRPSNNSNVSLDRRVSGLVTKLEPPPPPFPPVNLGNLDIYLL